MLVLRAMLKSYTLCKCVLFRLTVEKQQLVEVE